MNTTKKRLTKSVLLSLTAILLPFGVQATSDTGKNMHQLYEDNCASCHGSDHGGFIAPGLNSDTLKAAAPQLYAP
jgi:hypothetical protein